MNNQNDLILFLHSCLQSTRSEAIKRALNSRTNYITLVLEDIYQHQNYSAVLRSCECFGIQNVHVIENRNRFVLNPDVVMGANKWLTINQYPISEKLTLESAISSFKSSGYRIVGTTPSPDATPINQLNITSSPIAIVFGTELTGMSDEMIKHCDELITIPMYGLTASLNISVSAAIVLQTLTSKIREENVDWQLDSDIKNDLELEWLKKAVKKADLLIERFYKDLQNQ